MKSFSMPIPEVGDSVLHFERPGGPATMALVTEVFDRTVTLAVLAPHMYNFAIKAACRHVEDPADVSSDYESGFWDFRQADKALFMYLKKINELEDAMLEKA